MTALRRRWRDGRRPDGTDDCGSTLLEVMVGMLIMLIFLGMFSGAIVLLYQTSNRANALTTSASQTDQAFSHLDKTVRYAYAISNPAPDAKGWYVEYLTTATALPTCTQLWVNVATQQLEARTWTLTGSTPSTPTAWVPWASGITNGGAVAPGSATSPVPFTLINPGSTNVTDEQLTVQLTATSGSPAVPAQTNATFTALNSAVSATQAGAGGGATNNVCNQVTRP